MEIDSGASSQEKIRRAASILDNWRANVKQATEEQDAKSSSSSDSPKNSPKNMSDNEKDSDHIGVIPPVSEDDSDVLAPDFPVGPTPQVMQRRPRKPKRNNGPRNHSEELGSDFAKFIKKECPGCTKSQSAAVIIGFAVGGCLCYKYGKQNKPKTT